MVYADILSISYRAITNGDNKMKGSRGPVNLLSLDGGGVRGISELVILDRIMQVVREKDPGTYLTVPKPCEFFDMMAGTSTGGQVFL